MPNVKQIISSLAGLTFTVSASAENINDRDKSEIEIREPILDKEPVVLETPTNVPSRPGDNTPN